MPTVISHPAVPLAIAIGLGSGVISRRLLVAGIAASIVPDLDVYIGPWWGAISHRGVTHTVLFALMCGLAAALLARALRATPATAFVFVFAATLSHPLLDMCTNGGSGIPLLWPLPHERWFMPFRPIEVSPLGIAPFFSQRGLEVLLSEMKWVWLPALLVAAGLRTIRARHPRAGGDPS
jgi:inner membrane protein